MMYVGSSCSDILRVCEWTNDIKDCEELFNNDLTDEGLCCSFNRLPPKKYSGMNNYITGMTYLYSIKPIQVMSMIGIQKKGFTEEETGDENTIPKRPLVECGVPDCDAVDGKSLTRRVVYRQKLRETLHARFRSEYLGQLKLVNDKVPSRPVRLNKVVLVGNDNTKRLDWPLARVIELVPGKDGKIRLVRLQTARGQLLHPLQHLYPLEVIEDSGRQDSFCHLEEAAPGDASAFQSPDLPSRIEEDDSDSAGMETKSRAPESVTTESAGVKFKSRAPVSDRSEQQKIRMSTHVHFILYSYLDFERTLLLCQLREN
ncbi:hypothetical protein NQ314_003908 [Rhamnusium bicolor]|uniref:DUF5641 domain-containing protein n=1 Tax=Rhamnusium bicolor TaxID=1586634 RepID=A0AAV8ZMH9_9CUCU|nr:hypothetical protein NQ314_003908 [Rhamnusium bicolor]